MPRPPRYRIPGFPQHVVQRGNDRQRTFFAPEDYKKYRHFLQLAAIEHTCDVHAYVLMTNHVHLLVTPTAEDSLPRFIQAIGRRYVRYVNDAHGRTGTLWEGRYKACLVQTDAYLLNCYRYIELNPVRAGIAQAPADYQHSSFDCNGLGGFDALIMPHSTYLALGSDAAARCAAYRNAFPLHEDTMSINEIRHATASCRLYGSDRFRDDIALRLARPVRPGKPGRPRKTPV